MKFAPLLLLALPAFGGVTYDFQSITTGVVASTLSGTAASDGPRMRMHFVRGDGNVFPDDAVAITTDGGKSVSVLDAKAKTFYVLTLDDLASGLGAAGFIKVSSPTAKVTESGDGPAINGMPTRHVFLEVGYDMNMGGPEKTHVTMKGEAWLTNRIPAETASFVGVKGFRTGIPAVDKLIEAQGTALRGGFPLKEVVNISAKGGPFELESTTTATISNVKVADVTMSEFTVPSGFTKVDSPVERLRKALQ